MSRDSGGAGARDNNVEHARRKPTRNERWARRLSESRWPLGALFVASFADTLLVPLALELLLVPFMLARRRQIWLIAVVAVAGSVAAALVGYAIGYLLLESLGRWLLGALGGAEQFEHYRGAFHHYAFWAVFGLCITPIPSHVILLAAGATRCPVPMFTLAATSAWYIRYFALGALVHLFGDRALELWRRHATLVGIATAVFLVVALVAARFVPQWLG